MDKKVEVGLEVFGRVQGVNFRWNVKNIAEKLGLKGRVRNMDGGSVGIIAQGSKERLERFISLIKQSPGMSKVTEIKEKWGKVKKGYRDFSVVSEKNFFADQVRNFKNLGRSLK